MTIESDGCKDEVKRGTDSSEDDSLGEDHVSYHQNGFHLLGEYEHGKFNTDIMGVGYNSRTKDYLILDGKGITLWNKDTVDGSGQVVEEVRRGLEYPPYEHRNLNKIIYARKYNVYFALGKDFSVKVLNKDLVETCKASGDLRSVLFIVFNPVTDELITGGVGGTKVWEFKQTSEKMYANLKAMANYELRLKHNLENVGGSWVRHVELDAVLQQLYCCSDNDLYCYDMNGKLLHKFIGAHRSTITGCCYSQTAQVLVTCSDDTDLRVWSLIGGHVATMEGHALGVKAVLLHPDDSNLVISGSLDGSIRLWSLNTTQCLRTLSVCAGGVRYMGLTEEKERSLYVGSSRQVFVYNLSMNDKFWGYVRHRVTHISFETDQGKTTRLLEAGTDNSIRLFSVTRRSKLSAILPMPSLSPMEQVDCITYSRRYNLMFVLLRCKKIWIYTTRTDPACQIAVVDVFEEQDKIMEDERKRGAHKQRASSVFGRRGIDLHRARATGTGSEDITRCRSLCVLASPVAYWTDEGYVTPLHNYFLLLGLEDGRILFLDPVQGKKILQFTSGLDPVLRIEHDKRTKTLVTMSSRPEVTVIQVWSLPLLTLERELIVSLDLTCWTRLNDKLLTGHSSGAVVLRDLPLADDPGVGRTRPLTEIPNAVRSGDRCIAHSGEVLSVDTLHAYNMFLSCGDDGYLKIWTESREPLTEIFLHESLSHARFFLDTGDVICGMHNQLHLVSRHRVCAHLNLDDDDFCMRDNESEIIEDAAVMYEGVHENPEELTLKRYLVPFTLDFGKDFIEGKPIEKAESSEGSELASERSAANTDVYLSPPPTPRARRAWDLMLKAELQQHEMFNIIKRKRKPAFVEGGESSGAEEYTEFPVFGVSPGSTPTITPDTVSLASDLSDPDAELAALMSNSEDEDLEEHQRKIKELIPEEDESEKITAVLGVEEKREKTIAKKRERLPTPPTVLDRSGSRLSDIRIDSRAIMKGKKDPVSRPAAKSDKSHSQKTPIERLFQRRKTSRIVVGKTKTREVKPAAVQRISALDRAVAAAKKQQTSGTYDSPEPHTSTKPADRLTVEASRTTRAASPEPERFPRSTPSTTTKKERKPLRQRAAVSRTKNLINLPQTQEARSTSTPVSDKLTAASGNKPGISVISADKSENRQTINSASSLSREKTATPTSHTDGLSVPGQGTSRSSSPRLTTTPLSAEAPGTVPGSVRGSAVGSTDEVMIDETSTGTNTPISHLMQDDTRSHTDAYSHTDGQTDIQSLRSVKLQSDAVSERSTVSKMSSHSQHTGSQSKHSTSQVDRKSHISASSTAVSTRVSSARTQPVSEEEEDDVIAPLGGGQGLQVPRRVAREAVSVGDVYRKRPSREYVNETVPMSVQMSSRTEGVITRVKSSRSTGNWTFV